MPPNADQTISMTWLVFALLTVVMWGLYGVLLHGGQVAMGDPSNGRYKAFLWVGVAYFLTAVLAPVAILLLRGSSWQMPASGIGLSLLAGLVGAAGAFCVLLAFGAKGAPSVVMSIVFAGAPIVNAVVAITLAGIWPGVRWQFAVGILLAVVGGCMVTIYKPTHAGRPSTPAHADADAQS